MEESLSPPTLSTGDDERFGSMHEDLVDFYLQKLMSTTLSPILSESDAETRALIRVRDRAGGWKRYVVDAPRCCRSELVWGGLISGAYDGLCVFEDPDFPTQLEMTCAACYAEWLAAGKRLGRPDMEPQHVLAWLTAFFSIAPKQTRSKERETKYVVKFKLIA